MLLAHGMWIFVHLFWPNPSPHYIHTHKHPDRDSAWTRSFPPNYHPSSWHISRSDKQTLIGPPTCPCGTRFEGGIRFHPRNFIHDEGAHGWKPNFYITPNRFNIYYFSTKPYSWLSTKLPMPAKSDARVIINGCEGLVHKNPLQFINEFKNLQTVFDGNDWGKP